MQIGGPTGAFIVIVSSGGGRYGSPGWRRPRSWPGCLSFLMGLFRLGALIKFIPYP